MGVIGRDFHRLNRHHAHPRVFQLARDQLGQIPLDLIGHLEPRLGVLDFFARHDHAASQRTGDFLDFEEFQHVTLLDVVVVLDIQTALEAFLDFPAHRP